MNKDNHLIFEAFINKQSATGVDKPVDARDNNSEDAEQPVDGVTSTRNALGRHIMHMANYGIPTREEFIKIRHELHRFTKQIEDRGTAATEEEKRKGRHMVAQIRAYRSSNADDPGSYADYPDGTATAAEEDKT